MKRPLIPVALGYVAGVVTGHFLEAPLAVTLGAAISLAVLAMCLPRTGPLLLPLVLFLFGWANLTTRTAVLSPHDLRLLLRDGGELVTVRGRMVETPSLRLSPHRDKETSHTLAEIEVTEVRLRRGNWQPAHGSVMSRTAGALSPAFLIGQAVEITGIALEPPLPIAEGVFDYRRYLKQRGIQRELKVASSADWTIFGAQMLPPLSQRFRAWGQRTLARGMPEQDEALRLQWAMLLGWQTALTAEVSEPFMRSGTMHIFAISGLHIALIAGIFVALFRAATVPRAWCAWIVIPIIWFYTAATGWQASAIRSTVMMTVILAGWSLQRPTDLLNSLAAAACVILVWQPEQLFQASFQLSFFVVLSIALLTPPIETLRARLFTLDPLLPYELRPRWQRMGIRVSGTVWKCFATSLAAFIGSMPLIAFYFHLFTPGSLLANLVVVPVSAFALMSGLGAILTGDWFPWATEVFNHGGWLWMKLMIWLSETAANLPAAWCSIRAPGPLVFTLYYGVLLAACAGWWKHPRLRWVTMGIALGLAMLWLAQWREERTWHRITALPLDGGHAAFVQPARAGCAWLIDCGDERASEFTLKPFLQAQGVNRTDNFILTHGDSRQIGGAVRLEEMFPIRAAWASPVTSRSTKFGDALRVLAAKSSLQKCLTNGFLLEPWTILHPQPSDHFATSDDNAVVTLGTFDGVRVLFASDLGLAGQNALFTRHPGLRADIVITGLPGAGEPLATEWLEVLRPALIVVLDSEFPATRRASAALAARLRRSGAVVVFTRHAGAATISIRAAQWRLHTARPVSELE